MPDADCASSPAFSTYDLHDVRMGRLLGRLFVCGTLFLITFIGYSSQIFIIWPWYGRELSVELLTLLIPFKYVLMSSPVEPIYLCTATCSALLGMLLWNYYLVVMTDPGRVPKNWASSCLSCYREPLRDVVH